jgi:hypothetical protein
MPAFAKATAGDRSTGSKQTPNGLFIFFNQKSSAAFSDPDWQMEYLLSGLDLYIHA